MKRWMLSLSMMLFLVVCSHAEVGRVSSAALTENVENNKVVINKSHENIAQIFSEGTFMADNMVIGLPTDIAKKVNVIFAKMERGIAKNKAWFLKKIASLAEGEVFPYDKRLGVTKDEYQYFIQSEQNMTLVKVKENKLTISKKAKQTTIQIANGSVVNKLTISADGKAIQTNLGKLVYLAEITASDDQYVTGRWNGQIYQLGGEGAKQVVQISLGQLEKNNKKIIYIKSSEEGQSLKEEILLFD